METVILESLWAALQWTHLPCSLLVNAKLILISSYTTHEALSAERYRCEHKKQIHLKRSLSLSIGLDEMVCSVPRPTFAWRVALFQMSLFHVSAPVRARTVCWGGRGSWTKGWRNYGQRVATFNPFIADYLRCKSKCLAHGCMAERFYTHIPGSTVAVRKLAPHP